MAAVGIADPERVGRGGGGIVQLHRQHVARDGHQTALVDVAGGTRTWFSRVDNDGEVAVGAGTLTRAAASANNDAIACRATATNAGGTATATSPALTVPKPKPLEGATPGQIATAFGLPGAKRCVGRDDLVVRLREPDGIEIKRAEVFRDGHEVTVRKRHGRWVAHIDLTRVHQRTFTVTIRIKTEDGRTLRGKRTYKVCKH